jgi:hypothetical protein
VIRNLNGGGQGPIWAVEPLDGWMNGKQGGGNYEKEKNNITVFIIIIVFRD